MIISKKTSILITFIIVLLFLFQIFIFYNFQVDDSYISFRYSKNLIEYGVWNWNRMGEKVEAYTSFTYTLLGVIPHYFHFQPIIFFRVLGLIFSIIPLYYIKKNYSLSDFYIPLLFVAINPLLYIHSFSGLETPLFILLLFLLYYNLQKSEGIKNNKIVYVILFLLPLTRPEGSLFTVSILLTSFFKKDFNIKWTILLVVFCLSYFILRFNFFGYLFPNTFYVKSITSAKPLFEIIKSNIRSVEYYFVLLVSLFIVKKKYIKVLIFNSIIILIYYSSSNLLMDYYDRFNFQIVFPLLLFLLYSINVKKGFFPVILLNLLILSGSIKAKSTYLLGFDTKLAESHGLLGKSLNEFKDEGLTLALGDAGMVPYFSEWETIDIIGLANNNIAQNGLTLNYIEEESPDLIVLYSSSDNPNDVYHKSSELLMEYFITHPYYQKIGSIKHADGFYLLCYLKNNLLLFDKIKFKIEEAEKLNRLYFNE